MKYAQPGTSPAIVTAGSVRTTLTRKFIQAALAVACVVLVGSALVSIRRERMLFEEDMAHDAQVMVGALVGPFLEAWQGQGLHAGRALLHRAEASTGAVRIGWRPLEDIRAAPSARAALDRPLAAASWREVKPPPGYLVTAVRVDAPEGRAGAVLVGESLADERAYVWISVRNHVLTLAILSVLGAAGMWFVGQHFVGRPVELLVHKARRAGAGDLGGPVILTQRDELGELAGEMNDMCERLAGSRRRVEAESEARVAALEQLRHAERLATIGRLASGVAHELATPLNIILGRASLARSATTPNEVEQQVVAIERQVRRMSQIIRGLLDFARQSPPRKARVDVRLVAGATVAMLTPIAETGGVELEVEDGDPVQLDADEGQLQQVLTNLVVNAIQAGQPGGHVRVRLQVVAAGEAPVGPGGERMDGPAAIASVADDGPGMVDSVRRRVFEPFFTTKPIGQGTGLGLAVSLGIIREHGGFITVASEEGRGSCFSVVLPLAIFEPTSA
jgi:two-component system, NtrC family, sensor kinase